MANRANSSSLALGSSRYAPRMAHSMPDDGRAAPAVALQVAFPAVNVEPSGLPIKLLHDRVLVKADGPGGERRSSGGIVIPATATMGHRLVWAEVVAVGQNVRAIQAGDRVLYDPEERAEIEIHGASYVMLRERDVHALASARVDHGSTGLYL